MLARIHKAMEEREEGFTLIELLVVIIIIGILAAIAIPVFLNQRKKGWDAGVKSDLRNAATAEETYLTEANHYTLTLSDLTGLAGDGLKVSANDYDTTVNAGLPKVEYLYLSDGTTTTTTATSGVGGYCIDGKSKSGAWFHYDSVNSGLASGVC